MLYKIGKMYMATVMNKGMDSKKIMEEQLKGDYWKNLKNILI